MMERWFREESGGGIEGKKAKKKRNGGSVGSAITHIIIASKIAINLCESYWVEFRFESLHMMWCSETVGAAHCMLVEAKSLISQIKRS